MCSSRTSSRWGCSGAGSHASADAFSDGFGPAIGISAALSLIGAIAATGIPARRAPSAEGVAQTQPIPALEVEG
jgi:hypothetical protein